MKFAILKTNLLAFGLLLLTVPSLVSCKKDKHPAPPTVRESLVGTWEIKSFTIDGVEVKGTIITSSKMEFEAYTGSNGDFEWRVNYGDGTNETASGDYTLDEEDAEVELENNDGERIKFDVEINGDDLELSGILDGERYELKAERD